MLATLGIVILALLAPSASAQEPTSPLLIHVFTETVDEDGFQLTKRELSGRDDTVEDILDLFGGSQPRRRYPDSRRPSYRSVFQVAETPEEADMLWEVVYRGEHATGSLSGVAAPVFGGGAVVSQATPQMGRNIQVQLTIGDYTKTVLGAPLGSEGETQWRELAEGLVAEIAEWTQLNHEKVGELLAER